jgi:hypothetical protein
MKGSRRRPLALRARPLRGKGQRRSKVLERWRAGPFVSGSSQASIGCQEVNRSEGGNVLALWASPSRRRCGARAEVAERQWIVTRLRRCRRGFVCSRPPARILSGALRAPHPALGGWIPVLEARSAGPPPRLAFPPPTEACEVPRFGRISDSSYRRAVGCLPSCVRPFASGLERLCRPPCRTGSVIRSLRDDLGLLRPVRDRARPPSCESRSSASSRWPPRRARGTG